MKQTLSLRFSHWLFVIICMTVGISAAPGVPPHNWEGQIHLRQGDCLSGRIDAIQDGGDTLVLRHPLVKEPLAIDTATLARFEASNSPGNRLPRHWQVDLVNGDRLDARDWELTRDGLTLETDSAGRVTVPRAGVRSLTRMSGETPLLDGPGQPDDWTTTNSAVLKLAPSGGLSLRWGAISREISPMPDAFRLDLSIRYAGSPNWRLWFHAEDAGLMREMSACLLSRDMNRFTFLIKRYKGGEVKWDGPVSATVNPTSAGRHGQPVSENVTLFFDRSRRSLRIFLNGEALGSSLKIPPFESFGNFLTLHPQDSNNVELHDIRLSPLTELPPDMADQEGARDSDMIWLRGDKRIKGNIDLPETGAWRVRDASSGREIAKDEILGIAFAKSGDSRARVRGEALVTLRDGSRLTMRITGMEEERLSGESHVAGDIRLPLRDVVWIDWGDAGIGPENSVPAGSLSLRNGDILKGQILQALPEAGKLRFLHPAMREAVTLDTADLDSHFPGAVLDRQEDAWRVDTGLGGENLGASDLGLEGDRLTLRNRYAGEVTFPRGQGLVLTRTKNLPVLVWGLEKREWIQAGDIDSFTADPSTLRLEPGSVISRRIPDLPERFQIGFRVSEGTPNTGIMIRFAASRPRWAGGNAYELMIRGRELSFRSAVSEDNMAAAMGMLQPMKALVPERNRHLTTVAGTRFDFFIDSAKPAMWVYIDGKQIAVWKSFIRLPKPGNFFTLGSNQRGAGVLPIGISDLRLAGWDGVPPGEGEFSAEEDFILLRNQDRIQGTLRSIESGKIFFRVQGMDLESPADRLSTIRLANTGVSKASGGTDVELSLVDGSLLRMASSELELDGNTAAGISPVFGYVRVPTDAVSSIRWMSIKKWPVTHPTLLVNSNIHWAEPGSAVDPSPVSIPFLDTPEVLGSLEDVPAHPLPEHGGEGEDGDSEIRLAWNQRGLMVRYRVFDGNIREAVNTEELFMGAGVELYVAPRRGSRSLIQTVATPGLDPTGMPPRSLMLDYRQTPLNKPALEVRAEAVPGGYVLNLFFPWKNLDLVLKEGDEIAVQCFVHRIGADGGQKTRSWHPQTGTYRDPNRMRRVTLGPPVEAR